MEIIFNEEYLREMYNTGRTDNKHRFQPQIIRKYIRVIDLMRDTSNVLGLMRYNALNYEKLKDDKAGLSSVRVNDQYRIEFEEHTKDGETVATICNITIPGVDPKMIANNLEPAFPTHPGEILKEEIEYRGISQRKLAERMGIGYSVLNEILNARRPVTEKTAMMFEAALGVEAEPLMRLQMRYNVRIAQKDKSFMQRLDNIRKIAAVL